MPIEQVPAAVPSAPATTPEPVISATRDAANRGSFADFDKADRAVRAGKSLPDVAAPAATSDKVATPSATGQESDAPASAASGQSEPNAKQRREQQADERLRQRVAEAVADRDAEIARLRAQLSPTHRTETNHPPATGQPETKAAEWKRLASLPDAPKLADFESIEDHTAAMSLFIADKRHDERIADGQKQQQDAERDRTLRDKADRFGKSLLKAKEADPEFIGKIPPAVLSARPLSGLSPTELKTATFANVVAEAAFRSENPAALLTHLHANQADTVRIAALNPSEWLDALTRLDGRLSANVPSPDTTAAAPAAVAPSPISAAPPPPPTLTRAGSTADPKSAALARGDFSTFDKLEMQEKRARLAR